METAFRIAAASFSKKKGTNGRARDFGSSIYHSILARLKKKYLPLSVRVYVCVSERLDHDER